MKPLKALLVDDEPNCCESLEWQLKHYCPNVEICGIANTSQDARTKIQAEKPDVVFMDIQLQNTTGFDVLNQINEIDFKVVFVTAFEDYAIKAIRFNALDYLLKPVRPEELKIAVERVANSIQKKSELSHSMLEYLNDIANRDPKDIKRIAFSTSESIQFVNILDIIYCKSDSNYTHVFLANGSKITLSKTLKVIEELLDSTLFFRVHPSFLVNINRVEKYVKSAGTIFMDDKTEVPLSQTKKENFLKVLSNF